MNNKQSMTKPELIEFVTALRECCDSDKKKSWYSGLIEDIETVFTPDNIVEPNEIIEELHPDTKNLLKVCFEELRLKLINNQKKYGWSNEWITCDWEQECREEMMKHIKKGDPRDVAIYAMFMIYRGWSTVEESKELSIDEELVNEFEKYLEFFLAEDNRIRGLAETMAKIAQQHINSKLQKLEKWVDEINEYEYFAGSREHNTFVNSLKDKITSLKQ